MLKRKGKCVIRGDINKGMFCLFVTHVLESLGTFSGKETPAKVDPLDQAILPLGTIETVNLLRCAPENRSSPRIVTGKWILKN